jgi:hypothetical protein
MPQNIEPKETPVPALQSLHYIHDIPNNNNIPHPPDLCTTIVAARTELRERTHPKIFNRKIEPRGHSMVLGSYISHSDGAA